MPLPLIQPERYEALLAEKVERVMALLAPFCKVSPTVYPSEPVGFRLRAEFRMWHEGDALDYVMFDPAQPKVPVPVTEFPIAAPAITQLMVPLREALTSEPALRKRLFQVEFLATLAGDMLVTLIYHRKLDSDWEAAADALRESLVQYAPRLSIIGRSRKQKITLGADHVIERLHVHRKAFEYVQFEQSFTQPNARVNEKMIEWACEAASDSEGDLLELYCGNGNFTLPLAAHFSHVIATELSKSGTRAAVENVARNSITNIDVIRLSAEEVVQAMSGTREFRRLQHLPKPLGDYALKTLFVDPPRAGLDNDTLELASQFDRVLYVSCNPHTLASNLATLTATHRVTACALFDQFPYTDHMESAVKLVRYV